MCPVSFFHASWFSRFWFGGTAGAPAAGYDLSRRIRDMGLDKQVVVTSWMPPLQFARPMFTLDVGIYLRYPHIGGTALSG
jgi:hypothetical protein